jgi:UDP-glucose 6-dehydrogenase
MISPKRRTKAQNDDNPNIAKAQKHKNNEQSGWMVDKAHNNKKGINGNNKTG